MAESSKAVRKKAPAEVPVYTRLPQEDVEELQRRADATASTVAGQIRLIVHEALHAPRKVIK